MPYAYEWEPVSTGTGDTIAPYHYIISSDTASATTVVVVTSDWSCTASTSSTDLTWNGQPWGSRTTGSSCTASITRPWAPRSWSRGELAKWRRAEKERKRKRAAATERARELLRRHLTKRQRADYDKHGYFFVQTRKGHRYRVGSAHDHNVVRLNRRGKPMRTLCASIYQVWVPVPDVMLAQKLMLDHAEDEFLKIANQWAVRTARGFPRAAQVPRAARAA